MMPRGRVSRIEIARVDASATDYPTAVTPRLAANGASARQNSPHAFERRGDGLAAHRFAIAGEMKELRMRA